MDGSVGARRRPDMQTTIKLITVDLTATIRQCIQAIDRGAIGAALICDSATGRFHGVVTDGDIRRALLDGMGLEGPVARVNTKGSQVVARADASSEEIASLFTEEIRVIPVLDPSDRVVELAVFDRRVHLPIARPLLGEKELMYVSECVLTGWVSSSGRFVTKFEEVFADFCGVPYAVATSNGTTALHLALLALDIGPGDEVIVPTLSFIASANAVVYTGARAVFVDSDPVTWNLDIGAVERAITPRTKAVMPVHLYGHPAEMASLQKLCSARGLRLVEDAAEAHGARYAGRRVGSFGDVSIFSFYGNKIVTTGEGGMLVTSRRDIADRVRVLRDHGMSPQRRYWHPVLGYNYRMTNMQAALGVAQMERIESIVAAKRQIAFEYTEALRDVPGLTLPVEVPPSESVFWLYSLTLDARAFGMSRDSLMGVLSASGVETRPVFPVIHRQPIYATGESFPVAEAISEHGLSLPSDATLTRAEIVRVAGIIRDAASGARRGAV